MTTISQTFNGAITATSFTGNGSGLTNIPNSATTAVSTNTPSTIVVRDSSGNFSAGTITANLTGSSTSFTGSLSGDVTGTQSSTSISSLARSKLASGTANQVVINDGSGVLSSEAQLALSRGGLGTNLTSSTGVVKIASNTITASTIVDADISSSAAIADTKLGTISTAGKVSNSATTGTSASTASTLVLRDSSGNFSAGQVTVTSLIIGTEQTLTGSVTTSNATPANLLSFATTSDTVYYLSGSMCLTNSTSGTDSGAFNIFLKFKNVAGTLTASSIAMLNSILDTSLLTATVTASVSTTTLNIAVQGIAATTIKWYGSFNVISQVY